MYITKEVHTSENDCVFERYTCDLELPKELAGCTLYTRYCSMYRTKLSLLNVLLYKEISSFASRSSVAL